MFVPIEVIAATGMLIGIVLGAIGTVVAVIIVGSVKRKTNADN